MAGTDTAEPTQQAPAQPVSLADSISATVENLAREKRAKEEPSQPAAPVAPKEPVAPVVEEKQATQPAPARRRREIKSDVPLPPEPRAKTEPVAPELSESDRKIEEGLKATDKSAGIENLRTAYSQSKTRIAELENQIKQLQESPKAPEDYEVLKQRNAEMSAELERVALERHPEFRRRFGEQFDSLNSAAKNLAPKLAAQITPEEFIGLLGSPAGEAKTARLNELLDGAGPMVTASVAQLVSNYETLCNQKTEMLSKHADSLKELNMRERAALQERQQNDQRRFEVVRADLAKEFEYLTPSEESPEFNTLIAKITNEAKHLYFDEKDPAVLMRATLLAAQTPYYQKAFHTVRDQLNAALDRLEQIEKAAPTFDGGSKGGAAKGGDWNKEKDFASNIADIVSQRTGMAGRTG